MSTKEEILKKIQKYAEENSGKTPSETNFYEYAEIGIYDLKKHGWANYGELVHEAGLTPNKFDNTKYSREQLCELFIGVVNEKKKWPTRGVLDVRHHKDSNFPDSSTFYNQLGLVGELAQSILDYVNDKEGYEDVINICNSVLEKYKNKNGELGNEQIERGFVYLGFQSGKYKIGHSKDPDRRREDITLLGPGPMIWKHKIKTDDMKGVEKYWHNRFKSKWIRGEWFKLSPSDVKAFKRWQKIL